MIDIEDDFIRVTVVHVQDLGVDLQQGVSNMCATFATFFQSVTTGSLFFYSFFFSGIVLNFITFEFCAAIQCAMFPLVHITIVTFWLDIEPRLVVC